MNVQFAALIVSTSLAFGFGAGLAIANKPFVLEATKTPIGSFVLRYEPALPLPEGSQFWCTDVA